MAYQRRVWLVGVLATLLVAWGAHAAPISYSIATLSPTDAEHTRSTDGSRFGLALYLNTAGQAAGFASRYDASGNGNGRSEWLYDGNSTINVGLTDAEHTRSTNNYRFSDSSGSLNEAGQVAGIAFRYDASGFGIGMSSWLYDGNSTINIGLTDAEHTRSTDNFRDSSTRDIHTSALNQAGQVVGNAIRYDTAGSGGGRSAWLYDGSGTINVGLTDAVHTQNITNNRSSRAGRLNEAGQVTGTAVRFDVSGNSNSQSAWLYDGSSTINVGLTDAEHTRSTDNFRHSRDEYLNESGQVAGFANRFDAAGNGIGMSSWLYDGNSTMVIGLTDAEHSRSTDNFRRNEVKSLNEAGQAAGIASRYGASGIGTGQSSWLYDGSGTINVGLTDAEHTRSTNNDRFSFVSSLNEAGQVAGYARRYDASGTEIGRSEWLYDGNSTLNVGLTDAEHTRSTDGYRLSAAFHVNEAGQVAGYALRYGATGNDTGQSAWLYDGSSTLNIGLTDAEHTRSTDNYRYSDLLSPNEAGQVAGNASRFDAAGNDIGQSGWFYSDDVTSVLDSLSFRASDGYAFSEVSFLGEDGLVLGSYTLFDALGGDLGDRAFGFMEGEGTFDLGLQVDGSFGNQDWAYLASVYSANLQGMIVGQGLLNDMTIGQVAFLLTPTPVPVPPALWLFGTGLGLLGWMRQRKIRGHWDRR